MKSSDSPSRTLKRCAMKDKLLIDTSAWIASFKRAGGVKLKRAIIEALDSASVLTTNIIVLELLQGCRDKKEYDAMKSRLETLESLPITDTVWETAYDSGFLLRRAGVTVPTIDIILASMVKVNNCVLLHHDRHFRLMAKKMGLQALDFLDEK